MHVSTTSFYAAAGRSARPLHSSAGLAAPRHWVSGASKAGPGEGGRARSRCEEGTTPWLGFLGRGDPHLGSWGVGQNLDAPDFCLLTLWGLVAEECRVACRSGLHKEEPRSGEGLSPH